MNLKKLSKPESRKQREANQLRENIMKRLSQKSLREQIQSKTEDKKEKKD